MMKNHESNKKKKEKKKEKEKIRIHKEKPHQKKKSSSCSLHTMKEKRTGERCCEANTHFYKYKQEINISGKRLPPAQVR